MAKLTYQTGIATVIQFIALTLLNFANGLVSAVQQCTSGGNNCVSNVILQLLFMILITGWFAFLWVLGYATQDRRSRRLAQILIAAETVVALFAFVDARHFPNLLGLITSIVDGVLAIWVIILAFRLIRAKGGRVVSPSRRRRRPASRV